MKTCIRFLCSLTLLVVNNSLSAQGTAFTYQGQLSASGSPATGNYDFTFALFNTNSTNTGQQIGETLTNLDVGVTNGLFIATLNFGDVFTGTNFWLAIGVRANGGGNFTALAPLQELTPTPYAIMATSASNLLGNLSTSQLTGTILAGSISGTDANEVSFNNGADSFYGTFYGDFLGASFLGGDFTGDFIGTFTGNGSGLTGLTVSAAQLVGSSNNNLFVGPSGNATTSGNENTAIGPLALQDNTSGFRNTATGYQALQDNTSGFANTATGFQALQYNTGGFGNTANGFAALQWNLNGDNNTANGYIALSSNTNGGGNTANGCYALADNGSGDNNTADGSLALSSNTSGNNNTANGSGALDNLGSANGEGGSNNIALGYAAAANFEGNESSNIDIGNGGMTGENNTIRIGSTQTAAYIAGVINGNGAGLTNLNASQIISYGVNLGDFFVGGAGNANVSGNANTAVGPQALGNITSGTFNTAIGDVALFQNTTGSFNTAVGESALGDNTSGFYNTAVGYTALWMNNTGAANTALGYNALVNNTNGINNTALGTGAMVVNLSGNNNTAVGYQAIRNVLNGTNDIALGYQAAINYNNGESSNIDIGFAGVAGENQTVHLGDPAVHTITYIAGVINGNGSGLTNLSLNNSSFSTDASGENNTVNGSTDSVIAGGQNNTLTNVNGSAIVGGVNNTNNGNQSTINGGAGNVIQIGAYYALLGSGGGNVIETNSDTAFLGAGYHNLIGTNAPATVLGGGQYYVISNNATFSVLGGGYQNTNTGPYSVIPGGINNVANSYSFAAGSNALATNTSAFVWSDGSASTTSTNTNSVTFRAAGGYRLFTSSGASGAFLGANQTSWATISDRDAKKNFQPVNAKAVLDKLAAIPIQQWNYKWEKDSDVPNIGPMAQDFKGAFYPGRDDKSISTLEFDGVELAAIQGLNQKLNEKDAEIEKLKAKADKVDALEKQLNELKQMVQLLAERK